MCCLLIFMVVPVSFSRCDVWRNYAQRADLEGLAREQMYNGYRLCSDHFAENAYADPAKTRLLWTAVPTAAVEVGSPIDEGKKNNLLAVANVCAFVVRFHAPYRLIHNSRSIFKHEFKVCPLHWISCNQLNVQLPSFATSLTETDFYPIFQDPPGQKPQKPRLVRLKTTLPAKRASSRL